MGELSTLTQNVHVVRNRSDLPAVLIHWADPSPRRGAALISQSAHSCPNIPIKAQNSFKIKHKKELSHNSSALSPELPPLISFKEQTRAFLKVQDGCDRCCSYCIVPQTRPVVHSKPVDIALHEAQALVQSGHREIVITGVFLGAYGQESTRPENWPDHRNDNLADLLDEMARIPNLRRIRLSSLDPADVTDRLLDALAENRNIMPHLHLSLQSGSDAVLRRMCRRYSADQFRKRIDALSERLDRPAITTDIIVGFPGETQADFKQTLDLAKSVGFAKIHVFAFSPRRGTPAAKMQDIVENEVIKRRSQILRDLDAELGMEYRRQFLGQTAEVLIESEAGQSDGADNADESGLRMGRSERYFKIYLKKTQREELKDNDLVKVKLTESYKDGLLGVSSPLL